MISLAVVNLVTPKARDTQELWCKIGLALLNN